VHGAGVASGLILLSRYVRLLTGQLK